MIRVGWYRSVNNIQHAFAMNSFANELAEAAGRDPVEYLLELIGDAEVMDLKDDGVLEHWNYGDSTDDWPIMPKRLSNVLRTVAAKSGYGKTLPKGHGLGLAAHRAFHSYVATAVHVVVHDDGTFRIPQVDVAIDCGRYVNPEGVRKQIEGASIYGNTVAQFGKITTSKGAVVQSNFHDYPITRMNNAPLDIRVHIVEDFVHLRPCGVGEPGVPPYAPALVNAIYNATGKRIRTLPIGTSSSPRRATERWRGPRRPRHRCSRMTFCSGAGAFPIFVMPPCPAHRFSLGCTPSVTNRESTPRPRSAGTWRRRGRVRRALHVHRTGPSRRRRGRPAEPADAEHHAEHRGCGAQIGALELRPRSTRDIV